MSAADPVAAQTTALRLALIGAFPYPLPQGSQVYFEAQARALVDAGAECTLLTYGRGRGAPPDDLRVIAAPASSSPSRMRSGPSLGKPRADLALYRAWLDLARRERFDAVLAHNAEAAMIALAARRVTGVPVVYVVHTLLAVELSAYLPRGLARVGAAGADAIGAGIDRALARRADGLIVLAHAAERALRGEARGPVAVIPPAVAPTPPPPRDVVTAALARHGLERDGYALYSGNLDGYQDLELLAGAAGRRGAEAPPIVVATHTAPSTGERRALAPVRIATVGSYDEMRALTFGAEVLVLTRRRVGGYPVKLLNYMEAGRPIVAFDTVAEGLVHGESAWLLDARRDATPEALADALGRLHGDPELRARLGAGARRRLEGAHDAHRLARATIEHVERVTSGVVGA